MDAIKQFPHCDSRILHAPGKCKYCDQHPDWQQLRNTWDVAFTGEKPERGEVVCPSERRRALETIERWPGNRPEGADEEE